MTRNAASFLYWKDHSIRDTPAPPVSDSLRGNFESPRQFCEGASSLNGQVNRFHNAILNVAFRKVNSALRERELH